MTRIDDAKVRQALAAVRTGHVISLNLPLADPHAPAGRPAFRRTVRQHNQLRPVGDGRFAVVNDDQVELALQGSSQWDALAHFGVIEPGTDGVYHAGATLDETYPEALAGEFGIHALGPGIVTRGVLIDVVEDLAPETGYVDGHVRIDLATIERCLEAQAVELEPGDAALIYTGFQRRRATLRGRIPDDVAGLDASSADYWDERKVAALIADNVAVEANPADYSIHTRVLRDAGIPLGELWALEELAQACRSDGVYDFLLVAVPLNIFGAFGSPANAIAIR